MINNRSTATIAIFDSGIGGLSVYNDISALLPGLHYTYLFDNDCFPYGDKNEVFLINRVNQVISALVKQQKIDMLVVACNTASTICLPSLRASFSFPVVGVVPAIKPASQLTKNGYIGLLATKATINRSYTSSLIHDFASYCHVERLGLSELAMIAEQKLQGEAVDMVQLAQLMSPWLTLPTIPDVIVLGCTHYPFIKPELQQLFPDSFFIDSGLAIAKRVKSLLNNLSLLPATGSENAYQERLENNVMSTLDNDQVKKSLNTMKEFNLLNYKGLNVIAD